MAEMNPKKRIGTEQRRVTAQTNGSAFGTLCLILCDTQDPVGTPNNPESVITIPNLTAANFCHESNYI